MQNSAPTKVWRDDQCQVCAEVRQKPVVSQKKGKIISKWDHLLYIPKHEQNIHCPFKIDFRWSQDRKKSSEVANEVELTCPAADKVACIDDADNIDVTQLLQFQPAPVFSGSDYGFHTFSVTAPMTMEGSTTTWACFSSADLRIPSSHRASITKLRAWISLTSP
jgi:hypothetical protein